VTRLPEFDGNLVSLLYASEAERHAATAARFPIVEINGSGARDGPYLQVARASE
jgi:hypothetical protein